MAATTQLALPTHTASPLALWHLLSLDAPTVAALWVWFIAKSQHVPLPATASIAMALAVWMLYAADRLLDTRALGRTGAKPTGKLESRHYFHRRHRRLFLSGIAASGVALAVLLRSLDPSALKLYLIEAALLCAWFVILHATPSAHRLPKEIAVGIFFSAAIFVPTIAREPGLRASLAPAAILFAALCSLNCLFIYAWEHETPTEARASAMSSPPPHVTTRIALAHLPALAVGVAIAGLALAPISSRATWPICIACMLAAVLLLTLHRHRHQLSRSDLRAAADLALLTPLLLIPFLRFR